MKLIFNALGVLEEVVEETPIRQGAVGDIIKATFEGKSNGEYIAKLNFTRPDGTIITNVLMSIDTNDEHGFKKVLNNVWFTAVYGTATLSIYLYDGAGNIIANGQTTFDIEQTDFDDDTYITPDQYDELLALLESDYQKKYVKANVRSYSTISELNNDVNNLALNQIIILTTGNKFKLYKIQEVEGNKVVGGLTIDISYEDITGLVDYLESNYAKLDDFNNLKEEVENIKAKTDVVDVVSVYDNTDLPSPKPSDLVHYDKSKLSDNDIIKVLKDETEDGAITYYRFSETDNDFTYIGKDDRYTNEEIDSLLNQKSSVSVSQTGTSTSEIRYITIDGTQYKLPTGGQGGAGGIIVSVSEDTSDLPQITAEQMTTIYNAIATDGSNVVLQTTTDKQYVVLGAKSNESVITIYILLSEDYIVKYTLEDEEEYATATTKEIGGEAPVQSVNSKTGAVVLTAEDIKIADGDVRTIKTVIDNAYEEIERVEQECETAEQDLQDQIDNLQQLGRYLALWNSETGMPYTNPSTALPYDYRAGDWYRIGFVDSAGLYGDYDTTTIYNIGDRVKYNNAYYICNTDNTTGEWDSSKWDSHTIVNYRPNGTEYDGNPSTTVESERIKVLDVYYFDGTNWSLLSSPEIDTTNFVDLTSAQTINGIKTFYDGIKFRNAINFTLIDMGEYLLKRASDGALRLLGPSGLEFGFSNKAFYPIGTDDDLGRSIWHWREGFINKITDNNGSYSSENTYNVINASDIPSTRILTQAQMNTIANGKPTRVNGSVLGLNNPILYPPRDTGTGYVGLIIGSTSSYPFLFGNYLINKSTGLLDNRTFDRMYVDSSNHLHIGNTTNRTIIHNIYSINEKVFPTYLNNLDGDFAYRNNALVWVESGTITDATNTTFTGNLSSNKDYIFQQELTSLTINGLDITSGDNMPMWSISFKTGVNASVSFGSLTINWVGGQPTFADKTSYTIVIKKGLADNEYIGTIGEF